MLRIIVTAAALALATGAHAMNHAMDCEAEFKKAEGMISGQAMNTDAKVKAYRMAISAHEMCKDGKKDMAMKMYYETEAYIRS